MAEASRLARVESLRFLRRSEQDFAGERLRRLGHDHLYRMRDVFRLQHLLVALAEVGSEVCIHRSGTNNRDANIVDSQFFRYGIRQSVQAPF